MKLTEPQLRALREYAAGKDAFLTSYSTHRCCLRRGWIERCDTTERVGVFTATVYRARLTDAGRRVLEEQDGK